MAADFLLNSMNSRRNRNRFLCDLFAAVGGIAIEFLFAPIAMYPYGKKVGLLKQEHIAICSIFMPTDDHIQMTLKKIRILPADEIAARIILYVFYCPVKLLFIKDYLIVKGFE